MHPNEELITQFYTAFRNSDYRAMAACYHPEIRFSDPVFPNLTGNRARAMWALLCQRKADPNDRWFNSVRANDQEGSAHWEAKYKFPQTGRQVHNKIDAVFRFKDGKIIEHRDHFDFWTWSKMAFGIVGVLLGWTPWFQKTIQRALGKKLAEFMNEHSETAETQAKFVNHLSDKN